jgi:hypothetical protein
MSATYHHLRTRWTRSSESSASPAERHNAMRRRLTLADISDGASKSWSFLIVSVFHHKMLLVYTTYVLLMSVTALRSISIIWVTNSELMSKFTTKPAISWYMLMHVDALHVQDFHPPNPSLHYSLTV